MTWPAHLVLCATRYCVGRMTYVVGQHVDWLLDHWHELDEPTRKAIGRDLERWFVEDNRARKAGCTISPLGGDFYRCQWERVLERAKATDDVVDLALVEPPAVCHCPTEAL